MYRDNHIVRTNRKRRARSLAARTIWKIFRQVSDIPRRSECLPLDAVDSRYYYGQLCAFSWDGYTGPQVEEINFGQIQHCRASRGDRVVAGEGSNSKPLTCAPSVYGLDL